MEVYECVRARRTVRSYRPDPVPGAVVDKLLRAGRWAPSSRNSQPWHFIVVRNRETLRELGAIAASGRFVADAPMAIAIAMDNAERPDLDAGRALQQMELVAWEEGLGTCFVGLRGRGPEPAGQGAPGGAGPHGAGHPAALRLQGERRQGAGEAAQAAVGDRARRAVRRSVRHGLSGGASGLRRVEVAEGRQDLFGQKLQRAVRLGRVAAPVVGLDEQRPEPSGLPVDLPELRRALVRGRRRSRSSPACTPAVIASSGMSGSSL